MLEIYISYADEDKAYRNRLKRELTRLQQNLTFSIWDRGDVIAGGNAILEIDKHMRTTGLILPIVSPDSFASNINCAEEITSSNLYYSKKSKVLPIVVRPCDIENSYFYGILQSTPHDNPISLWSNADSAWLDVMKSVRAEIERIINGTPIPRNKPNKPPFPGYTIAEE